MKKFETIEDLKKEIEFLINYGNDLIERNYKVSGTLVIEEVPSELIHEAALIYGSVSHKPTSTTLCYAWTMIKTDWGNIELNSEPVDIQTLTLTETF